MLAEVVRLERDHRHIITTFFAPLPVLQNTPACADNLRCLVTPDIAKGLLKTPCAHHPPCFFTDLGQDAICCHDKGTFTDPQ